MHEASLVRSLLRQVETLMREYGGEAVERVCVEVGPLSGVEPVLFETAFVEQCVGSCMAGARLAIEEVPLEADCLDCEQKFEIREFLFRCVVCESTRLKITRGDGIILKSVDVRFADQPEESLP